MALLVKKFKLARSALSSLCVLFYKTSLSNLFLIGNGLFTLAKFVSETVSDIHATVTTAPWLMQHKIEMILSVLRCPR
jgi:hypothetical protein